MIDDNSTIVDIGCDHANLDIYLSLTRQNVYCVAVDIREEIIKNVKKKIEKFKLKDKIKAYQADGLENIEIDKNAIIVFSGLGTSTIVNILKNNIHKLTPTLIIQSNNDLTELRKEVVNFGYYIAEEKFITDRHKDYVIIKFVKGHKKYHWLDYILGPILKNNTLYVEKILKKYTSILTKYPSKYWFKRIKLKYLIYCIKKGYYVKK